MTSATHLEGLAPGRRLGRRWTGRLPNRVGEDLFAVYTHFEHAGVDNLGVYSLIIGARVNGASPASPGLASATIPASRCAVFAVDKGHPERVGERWRDIWASTDIV